MAEKAKQDAGITQETRARLMKEFEELKSSAWGDGAKMAAEWCAEASYAELSQVVNDFRDMAGGESEELLAETVFASSCVGDPCETEEWLDGILPECHGAFRVGFCEGVTEIWDTLSLT